MDAGGTKQQCYAGTGNAEALFPSQSHRMAVGGSRARQGIPAGADSRQAEGMRRTLEEGRPGGHSLADSLAAALSAW